MGVYCCVCATNIYSACENDGGFQVNTDFQGWNVHDHKPTCSDTCEDCGKKLREAITATANKIVKENQSRVDIMKLQVAVRAERTAQVKREKEQFEAAWYAKQRESKT